MYTEDQKQSIYFQWCKYQKSHKIPVPEYPYQAYTDDTYQLWEKVLNNDSNERR